MEYVDKPPLTRVVPVRVATGSGNWIAKVGYWLDPQKNPNTPEGKRWLIEAKRKFYAQQLKDPTLGSWNQEMEMLFEKFAGRKVFTPFKEAVHCAEYPGVLTHDPTDPTKRLPLIVGFDFGGANPAYFISQIVHRRWLWHRGMKLDGIGLKSISNDIIQSFKEKGTIFYNKDQWEIILVADISGKGRDGQDADNEPAVAKIKKYFGVSSCLTAKVPTSLNGILAEFDQLIQVPKLGTVSKICVNPDDTFLRNLLKGGAKYKDHPPDTKEVEKNKYEHVLDIIRYVWFHLIANELDGQINEDDVFISTLEPKLMK